MFDLSARFSSARDTISLTSDAVRCICGHNFSWQLAPVEYPCDCLNLVSASGKRVPWGAPPCPGASNVAHAKLAAWRCAFFTLVSPLAAVGLAVGLPVACSYLCTQLCKGTSGRRGTLAVRAEAVRRGLRPGTFEYNYLMYGEGRCSNRRGR